MAVMSPGHCSETRKTLGGNEVWDLADDNLLAIDSKKRKEKRKKSPCTVSNSLNQDGLK